MSLDKFVIVLFLLAVRNSDGAECDSGWRIYKDELCVKTFPNLLSYTAALDFCLAESRPDSPATLAMVMDTDMQNLLVNITGDIFNSLWLGSRYNVDNAEFRWEDGEPLTYTNWDEGYPKVSDPSNSCVEMRPPNAKRATVGKWADVNCQKLNMVMCQRSSVWTLREAVDQLVQVRKELKTVTSTVFPVGSIYIEYFGQPSPTELWPVLTWEDITSTYAGLFFRAEGSGSASWGSVQSECAPRITGMTYAYNFDNYFPDNVVVPPSGLSAAVNVGKYLYNLEVDNDYEGLRVNTEGCEVRPRNQAIRVWKRIA